jgi:large subunit ribosomal protein L18
MDRKDTREARYRRHRRVRQKVTGTGSRPRLCVFRSLNHIYAQVIDDKLGHTLVAASSLDADVTGSAAGKSKTEKAKMVGSLLAKKAAGGKIKQVAFDRNGCKYHGRVKALADAAREGGLKF